MVANNFNKFFLDLPHALGKDIPECAAELDHVPINNDSIFLFPFTDLETLSIVNKLIPNSSPGPDGISPKIFREAGYAIVKPMTHLINNSFKEGIFPICLKKSMVIPLHKKGDPTNMSNYRPISLTSTISKILEYAMLSRVDPFLEKHNIVSPHQHGFRSGKSTITAVIEVYSYILMQLENKQLPVGLFCDLTRAFDCVQHSLIIRKLERMGIRGVALKWLSSYLFERAQYVQISFSSRNRNNIIKSSLLPVTIGLPQGTILSPLLFTLFINDINDFLTDYFLTIYADDTTVLVSTNNLNIQAATSLMLERVSDWFARNKLFLNKSKTKYTIFDCSPIFTSRNMDIMLDNTVLTHADSVKSLGIEFAWNLKWNIHIDQLNTSLSKSTFKLRHLRNLIDLNVLKLVYQADIESRLRYGIIIWGSSPSVTRTLICQKRAIRAMAGVTQLTSCRPLFKNFGILTVISLYILETACYVHKNRNGFIRNNNPDHTHDIRNTSIHLPKHRLALTSNSLICLSLKIYNKLPHTIKNFSHFLFKRSLKEYLLNQAYYTLDEFLNSIINI